MRTVHSRDPGKPIPTPPGNRLGRQQCPLTFSLKFWHHVIFPPGLRKWLALWLLQRPQKAKNIRQLVSVRNYLSSYEVLSSWLFKHVQACSNHPVFDGLVSFYTQFSHSTLGFSLQSLESVASHAGECPMWGSTMAQLVKKGKRTVVSARCSYNGQVNLNQLSATGGGKLYICFLVKNPNVLFIS